MTLLPTTIDKQTLSIYLDNPEDLGNFPDVFTQEPDSIDRKGFWSARFIEVDWKGDLKAGELRALVAAKLGKSNSAIQLKIYQIPNRSLNCWEGKVLQDDQDVSSVLSEPSTEDKITVRLTPTIG